MDEIFDDATTILRPTGTRHFETKRLHGGGIVKSYLLTDLNINDRNQINKNSVKAEAGVGITGVIYIIVQIS